MKLRVPCLALCLCSLFAAPSASRAEDGFRLQAGAGLGFGGKLEVEFEDGDEADFDLATTYGFHAGAEFAFLRYFAVGGELGLAFWNTEDRQDPPNDEDPLERQLQLDLLVRPKVRFPLGDLELYGVVPLGLTYYVPSEDSSASLGTESIENEGGPGLAVGVGAGATYFIVDAFGLTAELGYLHRRFTQTTAVSGAFGSGEVEAKDKFSQLQLRLGAVLAF